MPKRRTEESLRRRQADCGRVKLLLENLWAGHQGKMAADLGVTQGLISKIIRQVQGPGRKLLVKLASQPGVNREWVIRGEGQPFLSPTKGSLPIAMGVLPGSPEHHPALLTGQRHPVADAFERPSRYWITVQPSCPLLLLTDLALLPGDLLLLESNSETWVGQFTRLVGKVFGVAFRRRTEVVYALGRLERGKQGFMFAWGSRIARLEDLQSPIEQPPPPPPGYPSTIFDLPILTFRLEDIVALRVYTARL